MTRAHAFSWSGFESKAGSSCRLLGKKASPRKTINIQDCITILHGYLLVLTFAQSRQHLMASQASFHPPATGLVWEDPLQHRGSCQLWKPPSMSHQRTTTRDHNYEHYNYMVVDIVIEIFYFIITLSILWYLYWITATIIICSLLLTSYEQWPKRWMLPQLPIIQFGI